METFDALFSRQSIREFTGEQVDESDLEKILLAANAAPVGMKKYEDVHLAVIQAPDLLKRIDAAGAAFFGNPDMHPLYGAPTLIVVSSKEAGPGLPENVACSNAAIIVENMALAAVDLGVGACHIWGAIEALAHADFVSELGLPQGFVPKCALALGKSKIAYDKRDIPADRIACSYIR
ncbi:MAG: nitroreductase family protein [Coriobacteriales bacterium]|jgi:FMN reductase (NADPH)